MARDERVQVATVIGDMTDVNLVGENKQGAFAGTFVGNVVPICSLLRKP